MKIITMGPYPPDDMLNIIYAVRNRQPGVKVGLVAEGRVIGEVLAIHDELNKVTLLIED